MRPLRPLMTALLLFAALPATAQINPFRSRGTEPGLSETDADMLLSSINRLNRAENVAIGAAESWNNPETGSRGTSSVARIFHRAGMSCHLLHHEIAVRGRTPPRRYDLTWCLMPAGEWKIVG